MLKQIKKSEQGFTIIEVLIVLAIAGLILLIVFLAVPALQRNQRNTSRKNDIARIGGAATEFSSNNNGAVPSSAADMTTILNSAGNLSQYDASSPLTIATSAQAVLSNTQIANFRIVTAAKCGSGGVTVAGTSRQMSIQYMNETTGNPVPLCQDI